jgi:hypothetical protein
MNILRIKSVDEKESPNLDFLGTSDIPLPVELVPAQFISDYYKKK